MAGRQILQTFGERASPIKGLGHLGGIGARKLEIRVGTRTENRGTRRRRKLFLKLVRERHTKSELAGFGQDRLDTALVRDKVLDFVAVKGVERTRCPREE